MARKKKWKTEKKVMIKNRKTEDEEQEVISNVINHYLKHHFSFSLQHFCAAYVTSDSET
uniref:Uncharacterized protein n=1 Tax=Tetranychus urticae TaxID=32264 RepID=T1JZJ6_TETUR